MGYEKDIQLELRFDKMIRRILAYCFIKKDNKMDRFEATDFLIYCVDPFKVGVRLRRYKYYKNIVYRNQFTIRCSRPSGVDTELHKIRQNLVDYILYGFVDEDEKNIIKWFLGDLNIFRFTDPVPYDFKTNNPPDSELAIYNLSQFPETFIVKKWEKI